MCDTREAGGARLSKTMLACMAAISEAKADQAWPCSRAAAATSASPTPVAALVASSENRSSLSEAGAEAMAYHMDWEIMLQIVTFLLLFCASYLENSKLQLFYCSNLFLSEMIEIH